MALDLSLGAGPSRLKCLKKKKVEAEEHLPQLCAKRGLPLDKAMAVYDSLGMLVEELPEPMYSKQEAEARARIERRDANDWPVIACALTLGCPIWTEDRDFFGAGVPTWTTDRVELFLANKEKSKPLQTNEESAPDRTRPERDHGP